MSSFIFSRKKILSEFQLLESQTKRYAVPSQYIKKVAPQDKRGHRGNLSLDTSVGILTSIDQNKLNVNDSGHSKFKQSQTMKENLNQNNNLNLNCTNMDTVTFPLETSNQVSQKVKRDNETTIEFKAKNRVKLPQILSYQEAMTLKQSQSTKSYEETLGNEAKLKQEIKKRQFSFCALPKIHVSTIDQGEIWNFNGFSFAKLIRIVQKEDPLGKANDNNNKGDLSNSSKNELSMFYSKTQLMNLMNGSKQKQNRDYLIKQSQLLEQSTNQFKFEKTK